MSDGHYDAGAGVKRETDPRDVTDDGEIELNLPGRTSRRGSDPKRIIGNFRGHRLRHDGGKSGGTSLIGAPE